MLRQKLPLLTSLDGPILITGHTGFKGTWLTFLAEKMGIEVVGFSLPPEEDSIFTRAGRTGKIEEYFSDIRNESEFSLFVEKTKPSLVCHLAAQSLVLKSYQDPIETFDINVIGTARVLDTCRKQKNIKAILAVTTDKVYENKNLGKRFVESDPLSGKDPYSASKVATESVIAAWQQIIKIDGGPKLVSARAGNVIGGGDFAKDRIIPDLIRGIQSKSIVQIRNPKSTRPWQHVLDPLAGYLLALEGALSGKNIEAINFGPSENSLEVQEVVEIFKTIFGSKLQTSILQTSHIAESKLLDLDSNYANSTVGWNPQFTQAQAINLTAKWWENYLGNPSSTNELIVKEVHKFVDDWN